MSPKERRITESHSFSDMEIGWGHSHIWDNIKSNPRFHFTGNTRLSGVVGVPHGEVVTHAANEQLMIKMLLPVESMNMVNLPPFTSLTWIGRALSAIDHSIKSPFIVDYAIQNKRYSSAVNDPHGILVDPEKLRIKPHLVVPCTISQNVTSFFITSWSAHELETALWGATPESIKNRQDLMIGNHPNLLPELMPPQHPYIPNMDNLLLKFAEHNGRLAQATHLARQTQNSRSRKAKAFYGSSLMQLIPYKQ